MVGRYVEIPYKKIVKAAIMFVKKTVQAFKMIWD